MLAALTLALVTLTSGCAPGPVELASPALSGDEQVACARFVADLPVRLLGEDRREVSPADAPGAAWGDPAITVSCGAGVPAEFDELSSCVVANGVGWFVPEAQQADESADVTWTAVGYRPLVSIHVPAEDRPEGAAAVIAALAGDVKQHLRLVQRCR